MQQLKNIDSAFKHVRLFTLVLIIAYTALLGYGVYRYTDQLSHASERIFIINDGKALVATSSTRRENIPVEAKDHVKTFHALFFTLSPDDKAIEANIRAALSLADRSAKAQYDDLKEKAYYSGIIRGNISQEVSCDSVAFSMASYPYRWRYFGKQRIIRTTAILTRTIITEGFLRTIERTEDNPHGFLIEKWTTLENKDLHLENR
ncbi:conjugative transposon protein TraK [Pseudoflavitalea sp. X16]|uniref:conjugative transposon protein TraK n=1 Tax=Paraflavitalea devenefica TaxID=2716334 RepID=UPI0014203543|nr:conjugative transposon protein TraK [Paraflavitalea devenefica]NII26162.1 conjugative transposon protein TraK [Paraflavitalea devenefica]